MSSHTPLPPNITLGDLRTQIDALDSQLLTLLNQRARVAEQVGEIKKREGTPFFRPDRVAQVIEKIQTANQGPLKGQHVAAVWREIMSACLALESPQRVAVLGPAGTFCEQAAIEYFGGAADLVYCANFDEVFHATASGRAAAPSSSPLPAPWTIGSPPARRRAPCSSPAASCAACRRRSPTNGTTT